MTTTVAVLGLGAMGLPMATNLAGRSEEFSVVGFNISAERLRLAADAAVASAENASEAAASADVVLVAVRDQAQLETLLVVVGADDAAWEKTLPMLEAMSGTLVRVGSAPGDGQAMKTVNQLLCGGGRGRLLRGSPV